MKIIRPDSSDPIAPARAAPVSGRWPTIVGRLVAILLLASVVLLLGWLFGRPA